jgi:antitoxin VapB
MQEKELLKGLDADKAHADELAIPLPKELDPLERLKGSVKRYDQPFESVWDDSGEGASDDGLK